MHLRHGQVVKILAADPSMSFLEMLGNPVRPNTRVGRLRAAPPPIPVDCLTVNLGAHS